MTLTDAILPTISKEYIADVGFPIAAYAGILLLLSFMVRDYSQRLKECQLSKDNLTKEFFTSTNNERAQHNENTREATKELKNIAGELRSISTKVDAYAKIIDRQLDIYINRRFEHKVDYHNDNNIDTETITKTG